nr:hypothetical protein HK105_004453 [Polyrhizophydium stewartii]
MRRRLEEDRPVTSKSQTISNIQSVFTDTQKIAYVGLCYLCISHFRKNRLENFKKAAAAYDRWSQQFMEKLYVYLELLPEERLMIENLAEHGLLPSDLSTGLLSDAKKALAQLEQDQERRQRAEQDALDRGLPLVSDDAAMDSGPSDVRYTILSHLFILSISDGHYDARARTIMRTIAKDMEIPYLDLVKLEGVIADQLRIYENHEAVKPDGEVVGQRNKVEGRNRWLLAGLATLAGLAAPFIGAGIGAALTTFGVTGAAGVSTFMAGTGGLAIITTGGVLTGGGMSGVKMMKRTRGIEEFEFLALEDALRIIAENKEKRKTERRKRRRREARAQLQEKKDQQEAKRKELEAQHQQQAAPSSDGSKALPPPVPARPAGLIVADTANANNASAANNNTANANTDVLWELSSVIETDAGFPDGNGNVDTVTLDGFDDDLASTIMGDDVPGDDELETRNRQNSQASKTRQTSVLITIAGWVTNSTDDHTLPFSVLTPGQNGDHYSLIWETKVLQDLGSALRILVAEVASFIFQQGLQATLLPVLMAGLTGPLWMIKLTYLVDNPWGNALTKAEKAGRVLADTLMSRVQGSRPVTLVGYSLGARVIYFCLLELAAHNAFGIVEEAYLFGTPVIGNKKDWERIASVVAGRVVNGYTQSDMLLGVLYRASSALWSDVAGLRPVNGVPGIESMDLSEFVKGHLEYRSNLPKILKHCGFSVSADKFEDQDDEEEQERLEIEEERRLAKESRERERKERAQQQAEEAQRRKREKEEELERKRKDKEDAALAAAVIAARKKAEAAAAAAASAKASPPASSGWFGSRKSSTSSASGSAPSKSKQQLSAGLTQDEIVADELRQMSELEDMMQVYWQPREIKSTLPPLVISSSAGSGSAGSASGSAAGPAPETASAAIPVPGSSRRESSASSLGDRTRGISQRPSNAEEQLAMDMLEDQMNELGVFDGMGDEPAASSSKSRPSVSASASPAFNPLRMPGSAFSATGTQRASSASPSAPGGLQPPGRAFSSRR